MDTVYGGGGNDSINGGTEADIVYGDFASQHAPTGYGAHTDEGEDTILGDDGNDTIYGDSSNVEAGYGSGNDSIDGQAGNDVIYGDGGDSATRGSTAGPGNDTLVGNAGDDTLTGEAGADRYVFRPGSGEDWGTDRIVEDTLAGADTLDFESLTPPSGVAGITLDLTQSTSQTVTTNQLTLVIPSPGNIETVLGSNGSDNITGNSAANLLVGNAGDDTLSAGSGNDTLDGVSGGDVLNGDDGNDLFLAADSTVDTLNGGAGTDRSRISNGERDSNDVLNSVEDQF